MSAQEIASQLHLRWMIRRDMPEVLAIERACFERGWAEEDFLRALRQRPVVGMVVDTVHVMKILGFMLYELRPTSLHILNFAVHPEYRRSLVGASMVAKLKTKLSGHRRTSITLDVRESNLAAQLFFRSQGFKATCVQRGFYEDTDEAAYEMQFAIPSEEEGGEEP